LELIESAVDGGAFTGCILQLKYSDRQPINEHHEIRSAVVLPLFHGELVHDEQVICCWIFVVHKLNVVSTDSATLKASLYRYAG
jgi:hypothetical protein